MNSAASNESGHWESVAIMNLNDEILRSAGSSWHDWLLFNPGWYSSPKAAEYKEKARAVLESEFGRSSLFVIKDPRISRFAPFWIDVLESAGVRPVIVTQVRNPLEVAGSLSLRNGIEPSLGHLLWLRHVLDAEAGSRGFTRFHSSYEGLLTGWPILASGMQGTLGISWPRLSAMANEEIGAFLSENLRHHVETPKNVTGNPLLSTWLRDAFAILSRWTEDGEAEVDHAELDRIRAELDGAAPAFAQLILSGERRAEELEEKTSELSSAEAELTQRVAELEESRRTLSEAQAALARSDGELSSAEAQLTQRVAELEEGRRMLSEVQAALTRSDGELNSARDQLSQTQSALAQRRAEADEVTAQLRATKESLAEAENARRKEAERAERVAADLEAERTRAAVRSEEIAALSRLLQEREAELSAAVERSREETAAIQRRLAEADQERELEAERAKRLADEVEEERRRTSAEQQKLRAERRMMESRLSERFSELAVMTRLLGEKENAVRAADEQAAWLRQVSAALLNGSGSRSLKARLAALMPAPIRVRKQKARLKRTGIFDPDAYLAAHPDVAEAGLDPLWHYINHGMAEGRQLQPSQPTAEIKSSHEKR